MSKKKKKSPIREFEKHGLKSWKEYKAWKKANLPKKPSPYELLGIFQIHEVLPFVGPQHRNYMGKTMYMNSQRLQLFKEKGLVCVNCGLIGTHFKLERILSVNKNGKQHTSKYHWNLYGCNEDGEEVQFTKDHFFPRSKGGKNDMSNYMTMCSKCNSGKGDKIEEDYILLQPYTPFLPDLDELKIKLRLYINRNVLRPILSQLQTFVGIFL